MLHVHVQYTVDSTHARCHSAQSHGAHKPYGTQITRDTPGHGVYAPPPHAPLGVLCHFFLRSSVCVRAWGRLYYTDGTVKPYGFTCTCVPPRGLSRETPHIKNSTRAHTTRNPIVVLHWCIDWCISVHAQLLMCVSTDFLSAPTAHRRSVHTPRRPLSLARDSARCEYRNGRTSRRRRQRDAEEEWR